MAGVLLGVYFREAVVAARQRLGVAARLEGHLRSWLRSLRRHDKLWDILIAAHMIGESESRATDPEALAAFQQKVEKAFSEATAEAGEVVKATLAQTKDLTAAELDFFDEDLKAYAASLGDGTGFITPEDAACLDWYIQPKINEVRSDMASTFSMCRFIVTHIRSRETPDERRLAELIVATMKQAINALKNIVPLLKYAERVRTRGVIGNLSWR
jgi:hypothetical protein